MSGQADDSGDKSVSTNVRPNAKPVSTNAQRQRKLAAERKAAGLVQVKAWVPKEHRARLKELAAEIAAGRNAPSPDAVAELEAAIERATEAARAAKSEAERERARADAAEAAKGETEARLSAAQGDLKEARERADKLREKALGWKERHEKLKAEAEPFVNAPGWVAALARLLS